MVAVAVVVVVGIGNVVEAEVEIKGGKIAVARVLEAKVQGDIGVARGAGAQVHQSEREEEAHPLPREMIVHLWGLVLHA